jgi:hypothetical protein
MASVKALNSISNFGRYQPETKIEAPGENRQDFVQAPEPAAG